GCLAVSSALDGTADTIVPAKKRQHKTVKQETDLSMGVIAFIVTSRPFMDTISGPALHSLRSQR
ncbi:MAG: hypothetical protein JWP08_2004, partial [Bryobacterales bacterium]|nr:hypothetical protein [Bryobacterales bacterium]